MQKTNLFDKIKQRWIRFRFKPIPIFVFHSVSEEYNPMLWCRCDWTQTELFKKNILNLKKRYKFIALPNAQKHLKEDKMRFKNYAVLTADDGYRSVLDVLPWLEQQKIPITLFVNTKYLDKKSWSVINERQARKTKPDVNMIMEVCPDLYMSKEELFNIVSENVMIGLHGSEHIDATKVSEEAFRNNVEDCIKELDWHPRYIPYFAYTWGHHNNYTDAVLKEFGLTTVLTGGSMNYRNTMDRICIDGENYITLLSIQ